MSDGILLPLLYVLPGFDWLATVILVVMARQRPYIGFLTVSAYIVFAIALATSVYAVVAYNTANGFVLFPFETAVDINRLLYVLLGSAPLLWLVRAGLLYRNRRR